MNRRKFLKSLVAILIGMVLVLSTTRMASITSEYIIDRLMLLFGIPDKFRKDVEKSVNVLKDHYGIKFMIGGIALRLVSIPIVGSLTPSAVKIKIHAFWAQALFYGSRSLAWQYVNYPAVSEDSVCDGLITEYKSIY